MEHRDDALLNRLVSPLCYTILLRPISDYVLPLDAIINAECLKLSRHVFPTVLSPCLELLERSKGLWLALQEIYSSEAREVINEGHPVAIALVSGDLDWAMHIAVDELEGPEGSCGWRGEWVCMHLTSLQASHTRSGSAFESSLRPVTRLPDKSFLMPARWWWQRWQCRRVRFIGRVAVDNESEASSSTGMVSSTRYHCGHFTIESQSVGYFARYDWSDFCNWVGLYCKMPTVYAALGIDISELCGCHFDITCPEGPLSHRGPSGLQRM